MMVLRLSLTLRRRQLQIPSQNFPKNQKPWLSAAAGVKNQAIIRILANLATHEGIQLLTADDIGLNADFIEAEAWGYLTVGSLFFYNTCHYLAGDNRL